MKHNNQNILNKFSTKKVLIVGDLIVDKTIEGTVKSISPDAPVPLLCQTSETLALGGSAYVAQNVQSLTGTPLICGVIGNDYEGRFVLNAFKSLGIDTSGIIQTAQPTATATRIRSNSHQLLRINKESTQKQDQAVINKIIEFVRKSINTVDAVILSDYKKGMITSDLTKFISMIKKPVIIKPSKQNLKLFMNPTLTIMSRSSALVLNSMTLQNETSIRNAGIKLSSVLDSEHTLITWIEDGFHIINRKGETKFIKSPTSHPISITGYMDAVLASSALSIVSDATPDELSQIAMDVAEIHTSRKSIVPVNYNELIKR